MNRRWTLLLTFVFLAAACGQPGADTSKAQAAVVGAAARAEDAGTARFTMAMDISGATDMSMTAEGLIDIAGQRSDMTMDLEGSASGAMGNIRIIQDGLVMYMKSEALSPLVSEVTPWIRIDLQEMGEEQGFDFAAMMQSSSNDPSQTLAYLRGASDDIEELGGEDVRGVSTTHYRAVIDYDKVVEMAPADLRDSVRRNIDQITELTGSTEQPMEVWIDGDGFARRMHFEQSISDPSVGGSLTTSMTIEMFDFGVDVDVSPPPDDEVIDISELGNFTQP